MSGKYSDAELLHGLVSHDEKIIREYYSLYFQPVRRFVLSNSGREEDARDLFQDALMVLFQKVRGDHFVLTCSLGTYIYSVSRFLWLKELGRRKWMTQKPVDFEEFIDAGTDVVTISEYNERWKLYQAYFEKLTSDCQKVLGLFMEGYSISEITRMMGYRSEQHTRNRRYRCKTWLVDSIRKKFGNEFAGYGNNKDN